MSTLDAVLGVRSLRIGLIDRARLGLLLLLAIGVSAIWVAPRPLMIDLPQHAGQVALLRDLALGRSPWSGEVRINLVTPYLIGYGLALPLAFVMPAAAALKSVLTLAYCAFVGVCIGIRRELGADRELDPYYAFSFFGFAYAWGMYTFLVAAPLGLAFIWLCVRYARQGLLRQGAGVAALGAALFFSHGLVFLFACGVGALMVLVRAPSLRLLVLRSWPFWLLLAGCAAFYVVTKERETAIRQDFGAQVTFGPLWMHAKVMVASAMDAPYSAWPTICFPFVAGLPLLAGFRPDWRAREAVVIAGVAFAAAAFAPHFAWSTSMLYERFGLFLPPAYAWLLRRRPPRPHSSALWLQPRVGLLAGVICAAILAQHARLALEFGREQRDFETVLAAAEPGQRALTLIFDPESKVDGNRDAYLHHALWYQADKHGFVDFNFAAFHPQIARFDPGRIPAVDALIAQNPTHFDWRRDHGELYRYVFVRSSGPPPANAFAGADCPPVLAAAAGEWRLYERRACPAA